MKLKIAYYLTCFLLVFFIPMIASGFELDFPDKAVRETDASANTGGVKNASEEEPASRIAGGDAAAAETFTVRGDGKLHIYNETAGTVDELSLYDYTRGAIAAEMPPDFHLEALKAQGVASLSYALRRRQDALAAGEDYDFSADPEKRLGYTTEENARRDYGDSFEINWAKVTKAADEAVKYVMVYDGEPILAAYHAISTGMTESAENVWGGAVPYLVPAESGGDRLAPEYETTAVFSPEEVSAALVGAAPETKLPDDAGEWFSAPELTPSGYVSQIEAGGVYFTGVQVREALSLRSSAFSVSFAGGAFTFTVRGYGHGVGLSQRGADYMARQGADFRTILEHYYTGAALCLLELSG